jgi:predicted solute-binding protein
MPNFKIMPTIPLQLGWIPYWNLLPLRHELERLSGHEIEFHRGHPSQVNRWLADGKVSLAPSSSVCLLKNSQMEIAFPLGIASMGPVLSVYIGLHHEDTGLIEVIRGRQMALREIFRQAALRFESDARRFASYVFRMAASLPPIAVDGPPPLTVSPASATGANLARILYRLWFGESAYEMRAAESSGATGAATMRRPMELVIGDDALVRRPNYRAIIDLGDAWRELTDLPFVFAVWQTAKKTLSPYWRQRISEAAELAQARMRVEPCHYLPDMQVVDVNGRPIDLAAYWKAIHYRLGPQHFKSLALFLALTRCLSPFAVDDKALVNIMRWESMGQAVQPSM